MEDEGQLPIGDESRKAKNQSPDRRELVRKLAGAGILPIVVATFVASDLKEAAAAT
jgi:hypothetical protein